MPLHRLGSPTALAAFALALALTCALATPALATAPTPRIPGAKMTFYDVGGVTTEQIRERMTARHPKATRGFDAAARWQYRWSWPGYGSSSCRLASAKVTVEVVVFFPRWTKPKAAPGPVVAAWRRYSLALAKHEKGHVDRAVAGVPAVVRAIKSSSCTRADAAARAQLDRINESNQAYDARTGHGKTQGATFP